MLDLLATVRDRLAANSYANEAAISHGVVTPVLNALGWDSADPAQVVPEFSSGRGRVDFALLSLGRQPAVFIEVKGMGRSADGDRQLFEYAFHKGVPICVLTDGREWSFYLPGAQGSYEDRRVYRLRLDERDPAESQSVFLRYLSRERVRSNAAFEDAQRDYRDAAGRREASNALPGAWSALLREPEDLLLELVADKAEALCGFRPIDADVLSFLRRLGTETVVRPGLASARSDLRPKLAPAMPPLAIPAVSLHDPGPIVAEVTAANGRGRGVNFRIFGKDHAVANASDALVKILDVVCSTSPDKLPDFAKEAEGRIRKHVARSPAEIYPDRPDLRVAEFLPGWFVGLNIANREKMRLIQAVCAIYGLAMPDDVDIFLPNSK